MCPFGNKQCTCRAACPHAAALPGRSADGSMGTSTPTSFHRTRRGGYQPPGGHWPLARHGSMGTSTPTNFRRPAPHRRKKNPVTTVTGFFLAGDEGFEPPQTESESGVLPLHKSPMPSPLKRHLLLYAKIGICQGLFFSARTCSFSLSSRRIRDRDTGVIPRKDATCRWGTRSITPG